MKIRNLFAKFRRVLGIARKQAALVALAAALVPLGAVTAAAVVVPVSSTVTPVSVNRYQYDYTINNLSSFSTLSSAGIAKFMVPLFSAADLDSSSITDPSGWTHTITTPASAGWAYTTAADGSLTGNPNKYGPVPEVFETPSSVLVWQSTTSELSNEVSGFSFQSDYSSLDAPFYLTGNLGSQIADPDAPLSPARMVAQGLSSPSTSTAVPEPGPFCLLVLGGCGWGVYQIARRRRRGQAA